MTQPSPLRITWFVPEMPVWRRFLGGEAWLPDHSLASVWIRGYQLAQELARRGFEVACNRLHPQPHIAIFLRRYGERDVALARRLKARGVRIVLDMVANYFEPREGDGGVGESTPEQVDSFLRLLDLADQVWAVSPFLASLAALRHPNAFFVSDSMDPQTFHRGQAPEPREPTSPLLFAWAGVAAKATALEEIAPMIGPRIGAGQAELLVIAERPPDLSLPYMYAPWRWDSFPQAVAASDLCLAPRRVRNDYDRGHSLFKIGVFLACGVPALAGPVPSYDLLLEDERAGAICRSEEDWAYWIDRFLADAELRRRWRACTTVCVAPYRTPIVAGHAAALLKGLAGQA